MADTSGGKWSRNVRVRLESYIERDESLGCWNWTGHIMKTGYGKATWKGRAWMAHRMVYTVHVGKIAEGMELDHLCRNRRCVNPDHLEPVTHAVNMARGARALATHCKRGHPYEEASIPGKGRTCKACAVLASRERYAVHDELGYVPLTQPQKGRLQAAKTHCPRGHEYDAGNTYEYRGSRFCRACNLERGREFRARRRAKASVG